MTQAQKPHSESFALVHVALDRLLHIGAGHKFPGGESASMARRARAQLEGIEEQLETLRRVAMHAEMCMRAETGDTSTLAGQVASGTRLSLPIEDWLPVVEALQDGDPNPASAPVDGHPCKGQGAEYLVQQDNSNPARERLGGWCEQHGGYTGRACTICSGGEFSRSAHTPAFVLHEPPKGPLVCDYCGKFVAVKDAKLEHEYGDYGSILSTTVRCPRHE